MARKRQKRKSSKKKSSKPQKRKKSKATSEREPWTPWGKWLKKRRERRERKKREREERRRKRREARRLRWQRRQRVTMRGMVFLGLLVVACLIGLLVLVLLGRPYPWEALGDVTAVMAYQRQINERQARWESLAIDDYEYVIEYEDTSGTWCGPGKVVVRDDEVIDRPSEDEGHWFPEEACEELIETLVIDDSFEWLKARIESDFRPGATTIDISFDPDFGYPTTAELKAYDEETAGCCWKVTWDDMRPIYEDE